MALSALYTAGIVAKTDQRPLDVITDLAQAMAGQVAFVGNELRMIAGVYVAPTFALGDDDFAGGTINIQVRQPRENTFNVVTGKIIDSSQNWTPDVDFPRVPAAAYITADGVELPLDVTLNAVNRGSQAQQLAAVMLRHARQALTIVATFKLTAYAFELFDTIELSSTRYGWVNKPFVVMGRKWSLQGLIELTLRETDPTIFAFGALFDATDAAANTNLPLPSSVQQLTGLAVAVGTTGLSDGSIVTRTTVTWTMATDQSVLQNGRVEIQWHPSTDPFPPSDWPGTIEQGGASETTIVGLQGGQGYIFRARFVGSSGRIVGAWSTQVLAVITPPPGASGSNMLINGSFELSTTGVGNNWTPYSTGTTGTITHSDATGIFGSRSQRIDCTALATSGAQAGYFQGVNLIGLTGSITQSIYANGTPGAKIRLQLNWMSAFGGSLMSSTSTDLVLSSSIQRASNIGAIPAGCTYVQAYFLLMAPTVAGAAFMIVDAAQLEVGSSASAFSESADEAIATAAQALAIASAAATDAAAAIAAITAIGSDNLLSSGEKPTAVLDYSRLTGEQAGIDASATAFSITTEKTAYDTALAALTSYLGTLSGWNVIPGSNVTIVGVTWRANWVGVYSSRQALLNAISTEASKRAQWAQVVGTGRPADNASADLVLIARGNCVATGNSVNKVGGASAWDSDTYSKNGFVGGCFAGAQPVISAPTQAAMFGLNSDPTTDESYTSLDFAWYTESTGNLYVFENGANVAGPWAWAVGDVLAIIYDGARVTYMQNNTQRRQVAAAAALNLFFDSSFYGPGSQFDQIRFGPLSAVTNIGTGQLQDNSATDPILYSYSASGSVSAPGPAFFTAGDMVTPLSYTNSGTSNVTLDISGSAVTTVSAGGSSAFGTGRVRVNQSGTDTLIPIGRTTTGLRQESLSAIGVFTVTPGASVTVHFEAIASIGSPGTGVTAWENAGLRVEPIKK